MEACDTIEAFSNLKETFEKYDFLNQNIEYGDLLASKGQELGVPEYTGEAEPEEKEPPITYAQLSKKITETKNVKHLDNVYKKYYDDATKFTKQQQQLIMNLVDNHRQTLGGK